MMDNNCLFCKIASGEIESKKVFENKNVLAFVDIAPMAKIHYLFIHKSHSENINDMAKSNPLHIVDVFQAINEFTTASDISSDGFRVVTNLGRDGGQTVFHTHFHLLGGEKLKGFGS